jgi:hypothetical protein
LLLAPASHINASAIACTTKAEEAALVPSRHAAACSARSPAATAPARRAVMYARRGTAPNDSTLKPPSCAANETRRLPPRRCVTRGWLAAGGGGGCNEAGSGGGSLGGDRGGECGMEEGGVERGLGGISPYSMKMTAQVHAGRRLSGRALAARSSRPPAAAAAHHRTRKEEEDSPPEMSGLGETETAGHPEKVAQPQGQTAAMAGAGALLGAKAKRVAAQQRAVMPKPWEVANQPALMAGVETPQVAAASRCPRSPGPCRRPASPG